MMDYTLIRSDRQTLALQISAEGFLCARAPLNMPLHEIESFIEKKQKWIQKHQQIRLQNGTPRSSYTHEEIFMMQQSLQEYLDVRVRDLWRGKGLPIYTNMRVTKSEKRWGSCSSKNALCFSYRLARYLPKKTSSLRSPFIDAIIYHELAHLREKNHGKAFWSIVHAMMPEYRRVIQEFFHREKYFSRTS